MRPRVTKAECAGWVVYDDETKTVISEGHKSAEDAWAAVKDYLDTRCSRCEVAPDGCAARSGHCPIKRPEPRSHVPQAFRDIRVL